MKISAATGPYIYIQAAAGHWRCFLNAARMQRSLLPALLVATSLFACKTPKLAERIPGRWGIQHYEEYVAATDAGTGHSLDECGYLEFRKGRLQRRLYPDKRHGSLRPMEGAHYRFEDSLFVIRDEAGATTERWLLTKDLIDYMEWVRVSDDRDSVFTMYLRK